ncbi:MAG: RIP metalloprotease RseP [candidate division WOR-3 bacterium]
MTFILVLIFLGVLITVHELGHFLACRISGIDVEEFSIGFGPRILSIKDNRGTKYSISLIPFGGYVKMQGEEKSNSWNPGDFWLQPYYKKIFVVLSGPFFNLFLAILVFIIGYSVVGYETLPNSPIYNVKSKASPFLPGDSIATIDGKHIKTLEDLYYYFSKKDTHRVEVVRDGQVFTISLTGKNLDTLGIEFYIPPVINRVEKGSSAHKAGLRTGDIILSVNDSIINTWSELVDLIRNSAGKEITLLVLRGIDTLSVRLKVMEELDQKGEKIGRIGITAPSIRKKVGLISAVIISVSRSFQITYMFVVHLIRLIFGKVPVSTIGGPIMIGKVIYTATSYGAFQLLYLLGLISINLCIVNLLPLPALDGWHFWVYLAEGITKRELPENIKRIIQFAGLLFLIILMVVIAFFDILRLFR